MSNRNRVLEETWEAQRYVVEMAGDAGRQLGQFIDDADDPDWPSCDRDRTALAAAAPEMARMLVEMQHLSDGCPRCSGMLYRDPPHGRHDDGCELHALLRKAGVLP